MYPVSVEGGFRIVEPGLTAESVSARIASALQDHAGVLKVLSTGEQTVFIGNFLVVLGFPLLISSTRYALSSVGRSEITVTEADGVEVRYRMSTREGAVLLAVVFGLVFAEFAFLTQDPRVLLGAPVLWLIATGLLYSYASSAAVGFIRSAITGDVAAGGKHALPAHPPDASKVAID